MNADDFRRLALAFDTAVEGAHMGHPDFRAHGRIFATLHADMKTGMVKLTPDQQRDAVRDHPRAFSPESGAWGRQGCTRVHLAAADEEAVGEALTFAWKTTVKSKTATGPRSRRPAGSGSRSAPQYRRK